MSAISRLNFRVGVMVRFRVGVLSDLSFVELNWLTVGSYVHLVSVFCRNHAQMCRTLTDSSRRSSRRSHRSTQPWLTALLRMSFVASRLWTMTMVSARRRCVRVTCSRVETTMERLYVNEWVEIHLAVSSIVICLQSMVAHLVICLYVCHGENQQQSESFSVCFYFHIVSGCMLCMSLCLCWML